MSVNLARCLGLRLGLEVSSLGFDFGLALTVVVQDILHCPMRSNGVMPPHIVIGIRDDTYDS